MEKIKKILILSFLSFLFPVFANAATLYFSPNSGSYSTGSLISVGVYVSNPTESMNAASGTINFSKDKLEVVSLSKTGSIFSLWVQEPVFSNSNGTINFEGVVFNPGFIGNAGKIITINFRVKGSGNGSLIFSSSSVLANDGNGTNILSNTGSAQFVLNEIKVIEQIPPETTVPGIPLAPKIISSTHPDSSKWYNSNTVDLSWSLGLDINAIRTTLNKNLNSTPSVVYEPPISEKKLKDLEDGIWYFHSQYKNSIGWGDINHFRIQIDTRAPEPFSIDLIEEEKVENYQTKIKFSTTDALSGIDYYNIKIEGDSTIKVAKDELNDGMYTLPVISPGNKKIIVQAFDKAGNYTEATKEITIKPLDAPIITDYPRELNYKDKLIIRGITNYPQTQVVLYFEKDKEIVLTKNVNTDSSGEFLFVYEEKLADGSYRVWAEVVNSVGAKSFYSNSVSIVKKSDFIEITSRVVEVLSIIIPLLLLIALLVFIIYKSYQEIIFLRKRVRKELFEAETNIRKLLDLLREDLNSQIFLLGRAKNTRGLTKEEEKIIKKLKKDVDCLEKSMRKEIQDIEKEIKQ